MEHSANSATARVFSGFVARSSGDICPTVPVLTVGELPSPTQGVSTGLHELFAGWAS